MLVVAEPSTASSSAIVWCWLCASALLLEAACSASGSGDMARASAARSERAARARAVGRVEDKSSPRARSRGVKRLVVRCVAAYFKGQ